MHPSYSLRHFEFTEGVGTESKEGPIAQIRTLAGQAFSRAAGAPLVEGNDVRLLRDAGENYPAWLEAIGSARDHVHLECYIIRDDESGNRFAEALTAKAADGVRVRVIYDWLGCRRTASRRFWERLCAGGVEVRSYNPFRLDRPLGWLSRDHRKMLAVDGRIGFITGLCIGHDWEGDPEKGIMPWRDTGVAVRGPAVADIEHAFAQVWAMTGAPIPEKEMSELVVPPRAGDVSMRVVASLPTTSGLFRLDQLIASLAGKRLWLTDAYYAGTTAYVQSLKAAAADGVDVRLLLPGASDILLMKSLSRVGYRTLLESGVRVFEWNGPMLHAKTAIADGHWARVGSTNLNVASWFGNCELDAVVEDVAFARVMEEAYLRDLENATEIVLNPRRKIRTPHRHEQAAGGSASRAAAGAVRITNVIGAAFSGRRMLDKVEARVLTVAGFLMLALAVLFAFFPRLLAYPLVLAIAWIALTLLFRGISLRRQGKSEARLMKEKAKTQPGAKAGEPGS